MKKIQIIILIGVGLLSFAGAFGITSFVKKSPSDALGDVIEGGGGGAQREIRPVVKIPTEVFYEDESKGLRKAMLEEDLRNLIIIVRETMEEHKYKEQELSEQEQRIAMSRKTLLEEVERLSKLHDQMRLTVGDLRAQEESLKNRLVEITTVEKTNLVRIAAMYDKMDVTQSSTIMINMASNKQMDDAVKIIYLMSERTAAKLLGEISTTKPDLASLLSSELKKVKESG